MASFRTLFISWADKYPKITPNTIAPTVNYKKSMTIFVGGGLDPLTSYKLIVKRTIHDPSLNKL